MITFRVRGGNNFSKTKEYLISAAEASKAKNKDPKAKETENRLKAATPVDTGKTADSWSYDIKFSSKSDVVVSFYNYNVVRGIPIAILLQYGHATRSGGWVPGRDYINPVIVPAYKKIVDEIWRGVSK